MLTNDAIGDYYFCDVKKSKKSRACTVIIQTCQQLTNITFDAFKNMMMNEQNQDDESSKDDTNTGWKKSPEEAHFSDWSIEVKHDEYIDGTTVVPAKTATYSVHRVFLATETGSAHFMQLFTGPFLESRKNHSVYDLPVPDISFHHWETFLNYCYYVGLKFNPENAVPMYYFGDYFGVDQLKNHAHKYL